MGTTEILQNIKSLSLAQQVSIIESLLNSVKEETFKQIENQTTNNIELVYRIFFLNNEAQALHTFVDKLSSTDLPIEKGDKQIDPTALFGIWENNPRDLESIRKNNWTRNWGV